MSAYHPDQSEIRGGFVEAESSAFVVPEVLNLTREAKGFALAIAAINGGIDPGELVISPAPVHILDAETHEELSDQEVVARISHDIAVRRAIASNAAEELNK